MTISISMEPFCGGGMKIAVIGANGQLGHDVVQAFADRGDEVCALNHHDIELSSLESVAVMFTRYAGRGCGQYRGNAQR